MTSVVEVVSVFQDVISFCVFYFVYFWCLYNYSYSHACSTTLLDAIVQYQWVYVHTQCTHKQNVCGCRKYDCI